MKIFRNRTVIGVLCILLALIICFGVTPLFSRSASEKTEIVRVTKDIKEGDEITAEMVQTVEVGAYNLPQNLMTDKKEVVGKYATADLAAGDYILSSKLSAVPAAENAYLYNLDGKKQAISVTIKSFATGLSGKLESGDTVLFSALSVESGAVRRKGETMNIRKAVDYSTMFATLESVMKADLPQMELYCEIGKAVCAHSEKGAAVAAAEFIKEQYPDMTGFSPRNVRRMRDFWQLYSGTPELLGEALHLNWTQNVVIMEAELPAEERRWYIRQATARNLSKAELLRMIEDSAYLESVLDEKVDVWYNEGNDEISERTQYEEDPVYLSWKYLPQPHGRVRDEGLGKKGGTGIAISYRISGYQSGGDRQPSLSSGTAQAGRAWDLLRRPCRTAVDKSGLRRIRSPDRHGPGQPPGYVPHLRRRLCRQDVPPDGPHRSSRQCGGPMVHRGLRGDLARCAGGLPRTFERIHDRTR